MAEISYSSNFDNPILPIPSLKNVSFKLDDVSKLRVFLENNSHTIDTLIIKSFPSFTNSQLQTDAIFEFLSKFRKIVITDAVCGGDLSSIRAFSTERFSGVLAIDIGPRAFCEAKNHLIGANAEIFKLLRRISVEKNRKFQTMFEVDIGTIRNRDIACNDDLDYCHVYEEYHFEGYDSDDYDSD